MKLRCVAKCSIDSLIDSILCLSLAVLTFMVVVRSKLHERVDFVVCLGGDGVILHASNLFSNSVPPVVSFNLGSLGFLTAHPVSGTPGW